MSVIAEIRLAADDFALGRLLSVQATERVELETMVPVGGRTVPYFWVYHQSGDSSLDVPDADSVADIRVLDTFEDRTLYALDWTGEPDVLMDAIQRQDAQLLLAVGSGDAWRAELRFPSHAALSTFDDDCEERGVDVTLERVYNPTKPNPGPWFGLTERQREALVLAVERGYYDIPRRASTVAVADELGISDQAMTERLRRAITALVDNTVMDTGEA